MIKPLGKYDFNPDLTLKEGRDGMRPRNRKLIVKHMTSEDEIREEPLDLEQSDDDMDDDSDEVADDFEVKTDRDL